MSHRRCHSHNDNVVTVNVEFEESILFTAVTHIIASALAVSECYRADVGRTNQISLLKWEGARNE